MLAAMLDGNNTEHLPQQTGKISARHGLQDKEENTIWFENGPAVDHKSRDDELHDPQEQLCAGERLDDHSEHPKENNQVNGNNNLMAEDNDSCSEKRRQFSLTHSPGSSAFQSVDSASSELSSRSRHSLSSFLQAREYDAEDVLLSLGLGGDGRMSVPERFLVKSSWAKGIDVGVIRRNIDEEDDDIFDTNSLSYSSSWSERNPILERLPKRFITSTSSFGSTTDLSEPEDHETVQISPLPVIIEPEQSDENSFDLMRHLRLNRVQSHSAVREHQHDRIHLEPVTEELEVSSVGSGSARTKISNTQQDSLDSIGNTSVLTKISRRHSEDSFKERIPLDNSSFQEDHQQATEEPLQDNGEDRDRNTDNSNRYAQANQGDNESGISSAGDSVNYNIPGCLNPPVLRVLAAGNAHHDSLELEEIATSEENLDKIDAKRSGEKASTGKTRALKRDNSDESSGFEDDAQVKKRSTESLDADDVKTDDSNVNCKTNDLQKHFIVPFDVSSPNTDADTRRSAFAKRSAWSTSKQKRVAFQDEALESRPKSRSFDTQNLSSSYRLEIRRYSLDVPLTCTDTRETDIVAVDQDTNQIDQLESTPEKNPVQNIKKFLSSLMSIRSRFRKDAQAEGLVPSATDHVLPTGVIPAQTSVPGQVTRVIADSSCLTHEVGQGPRDGRHEEATTEEIQCLVPRKGAFQSLEELESFEENLKRYRTTFMNMQMTSTSQESYYTTKLLARFAWDMVAIRKLRSLIHNELITMQSCLTDRRGLVSQLSNTPLPHGVVNQMHSLLSMQSSLQTYLFKLAQSVPSFNWQTTPSPLLNRAAMNTSELTTQGMTNQIKHSLFQELNQMFREQIESLRKELKEKDGVINELLNKVERIEKASGNPKQQGL